MPIACWASSSSQRLDFKEGSLEIFTSDSWKNLQAIISLIRSAMLLLWMLSCVFISCVIDVLSTSIPSIEYFSLQSLYNDTRGSEWTWKDTATSGPIWFEGSSQPCDTPNWQGLGCKCDLSGSCNVVSIVLNNYTLNGTIPSTIGNFAELTTLELSNNWLTGLIPAQIGDLSELRFLKLSYAGLLGSVPEELYSCTQLSVLDVNKNYLEGTLSSKIGQLSNLTSLNLGRNSFEGSIPPALGSLANLTALSLVRNFFQGTLPPEFYNLHQLRDCFMYANLFEGTLSSAVSKLVSLSQFELFLNGFDGPLPDSLGSLTNITNLQLSSNQFTGTIPDSLYHLRSLRLLYLDGNRFHGTLSSAVGNLTNLELFQLTTNFLNGTIPAAIGDITGLQVLQIGDNYFTGPFPEHIYSIASLTTLDISYCLLTGSLSNSLSNWARMITLTVYGNYLTGTIPASIGNLTRMTEVYLRDNYFNGSLPVSLYSLQNMLAFDAGNNNLTGSISAAIGNWSKVIEIKVNNNDMTGSLPSSLGTSPLLDSLEAYGNYFTGPIPSTLCAVHVLYALYLQDNLLSQALPNCLLSSNSQVASLSLGSNQLTGTLPSRLSNARLASLELYENQLSGPLPGSGDSILEVWLTYSNGFTGTLPEQLFFSAGNQLRQLELQDNHLSGGVPSQVGNLTIVQYLDVSSNSLSGRLPAEFALLPLLQIFFVNNNMFTGSLDCFDATQPLININLSKNWLTGRLPEAPFLVSQVNSSLLSFAAVSNCFTGALPLAMCNATTLTALALDGLHTSTHCQRPLIPRVSHSYDLDYYTPGSIPECLFQLPVLETLHVSGNGMKGALPAELEISESVSDLALSYNQFTGDIPFAIEQKAFAKLDLSYNWISGTLDVTSEKVNSTLYLQVNRLSGEVPAQVKHIQTIAILNGNHFACQSRSELPSHDASNRNYFCGTTLLEHSSYVWLALLLAVLTVSALVALLKWTGNARLAHWTEWAQKIRVNVATWLRVFSVMGHKPESLGGVSNLLLAGSYFRRLRTAFLVITLYVVLVLIPINVSLSYSFATYQYKYAWNVASIYLSGLDAGVVLLVFLLLFLVWLFGCFYYFLVGFTTSTPLTRPTDEGATALPLRHYFKMYATLFAIAVLNFTIILWINIGYVSVTTHYGSTIVTVTQFALASWKLLWNDYALRYFSKRFHEKFVGDGKMPPEEARRWEGRVMNFNTVTMIFNVILIPCLATAAISSDCYYDVLVQPQSVESTFSYQTCSSLQSVASNVIQKCPELVTVTTTTSYVPPYMYRFQCASTLVSTYAILYVYKFFLVAFVQPAFVLLTVRYSKRLDEKTRLFRVLRYLVPQCTRNTEYYSNPKHRLFSKERFNLRMLMYLSIFATFGVIFPPLAVMICVSVWVQSYLTQLTIGRMVCRTLEGSEERLRLLQRADENCRNAAVLFKQTVYEVGPSASFLFAFILFDTYGDAVGGTAAVWMPAVMVTLGCGLSAAFRYAIDRPPVTWRNRRLFSTDNNVELSSSVALAATLSALHSSKGVMVVEEGGGADSFRSVDIS